MPTNFKQSIKQFVTLSTLQRSVKRLQTFSGLQQFSFLKKYIPAMVVVFILLVGLIIGRKIASFSKRSVSIPKPAALPTITIISPDSSLAPLKQSVEQFNPQLPDPLMPEFNNQISLEELPD